MINYILSFMLFSVVSEEKENNYEYLDKQIELSVLNIKEEYEDFLKNSFNGEDKEIIIKKINRYLNSNLKGKGRFIVEYSLKVGVDPYLVTAVMLQETGCYWKCSYLARVCNNVGGNKGKPSCNNGSYREFDTLDDGIKFAINKLNKYYKKGYKTPKQINKYYATDKTWYKKVDNYIKKLKKDL